MMPFYAYVGVVVLLVSEAAMFAHVEPFWSWHTPIAWTGYILIADGLVYKKRRSSWLMNNRAEFTFLAIASIPLWVVFEWYNLFIRNWHYINLPENPVVRYFGYAWSFATISPAIFETAELIDIVHRPSSIVRRRSSIVHRPSSRTDDRRRWTVAYGLWTIAGAAMLLWPLLFPNPYLAAPVWLGFIFLLDPINRRLGCESLTGDFADGSLDRAINLGASGFICGVLWEFWNYWARTKWIYDVPIMQNLKVFEMPVPGYLGFPAFALECFTMYVFVRRALWRRAARPIAV